MDNVVDFESKRSKQIEECEHEQSCPHCSFVNSVVSDFIVLIEGLDIKSDAFEDEVRELIEYVEYITEQNTLRRVAGSLIHEIDEI